MCIRPFEALSLQGGDAHFSFTNAGIYAHPVKCCRDDRTLCLNGTCVHPMHQTVPNAFMAAPPRHPLFAQLILGLERSRNARFNARGNPLAATGPIYLANSLFRWVSLEARRHVRIHPAPRILNRVGSESKNHPCAFEGPAATIAAYTRQVCLENGTRNGTRNRRPIVPNCAAARAWRNMSRADELLLSSTGGAQISPEQLGCARLMPTSVTTTFWAASWVPRFLEDRNRSRQASRVQPKAALSIPSRSGSGR